MLLVRSLEQIRHGPTSGPLHYSLCLDSLFPAFLTSFGSLPSSHPLLQEAFLSSLSKMVFPSFSVPDPALLLFTTVNVIHVSAMTFDMSAYVTAHLVI